MIVHNGCSAAAHDTQYDTTTLFYFVDVMKCHVKPDPTYSVHLITSTVQLCSSLGTSLNRFEMETALFVLDKDGSGLISEGEFVDWYRGSAASIPTN